MHLIHYHSILAPLSRQMAIAHRAGRINTNCTSAAEKEGEKGGRHYIHWPLTHLGLQAYLPARTPARYDPEQESDLFPSLAMFHTSVH